MTKKVARRRQGTTYKAGNFWAPQRGEKVHAWGIGWIPARLGFAIVMVIAVGLVVFAVLH